MYYSEKFIDEILCCRYDPDDPYKPIGIKQLSERVRKAETLLKLAETPSLIDNRKVKCACKNDNCHIGLNFDDDPPIILLTDKFGNETAMHLIKQTKDQIIEILKTYKFKK